MRAIIPGMEKGNDSCLCRELPKTAVEPPDLSVGSVKRKDKS